MEAEVLALVTYICWQRRLNSLTARGFVPFLVLFTMTWNYCTCGPVHTYHSPGKERTNKEEITGPETDETWIHCCPGPSWRLIDSAGCRVMRWLEDSSGCVCPRPWPSTLPKGHIHSRTYRGGRGVVSASGRAGNKQRLGCSFILLTCEWNSCAQKPEAF